MGIPLRIAEPTGRYLRSLRRYRSRLSADGACPQPGESWLIALPDGGEWITTQKATGGGHWTVTGTPPLITVSPSIWHNSPNGWHGWIREGELVDA